MPKAAKPKKAKPTTTATAAGRAAARATKGVNATATSASNPAVAGRPPRTPGRALRSRGAVSPNITLDALQKLTRKPRKRRVVQVSETIDEDTGGQEPTEELTGATTCESSAELQTEESAGEGSGNQVDEPVADAVTTDQNPSETDNDGEADTGHKTPISSPLRLQFPSVAVPWYIDQAVQTEPSPLCTGVEDKLTVQLTNVIGYAANSPAELLSVHKLGLILTQEELEFILERRNNRELGSLRKSPKTKNVTNWHSILHGPVDVGEDRSSAKTILRADDPIATTASLPLHDLFTDAENPKWISGNASFFQNPLPTGPSAGLSDVDMLDVEDPDLADEAEADRGPESSIERTRRRESAASTTTPEETEAPAATPSNRNWGIFSLPNSIARGLSSTVSSLLGQSHQPVDNSGLSNPTPRNVTRQHRDRGKSERSNTGAQRRGLTEEEKEHHHTTARLQQDLWRVKKRMEQNRQKYDTLPVSSRRKKRTTPKALNTVDTPNTLNLPKTPDTSSPLTRKRKYNAPPGCSYGLPDELFHSSDSDEPVTPPGDGSPKGKRAMAGNGDTTGSTERPAKKARVMAASKPTTPPRKVPKAKKVKKIFSPPEGASYGLSDAFYAYTSSEESDGSDEDEGGAVNPSQDTILSDRPQADAAETFQFLSDEGDDMGEGEVVREVVSPSQPATLFDKPRTSTIEPPHFLTPTRGQHASGAADGREVTWTKPPPPPPTPAHAKLPGERVEVTESSALARARSLTEQYKPAKPSGLRRVSILSVSTASPPASSPRTHLGDIAGREAILEHDVTHEDMSLGDEFQQEQPQGEVLEHDVTHEDMSLGEEFLQREPQGEVLEHEETHEDMPLGEELRQEESQGEEAGTKSNDRDDHAATDNLTGAAQLKLRQFGWSTGDFAGLDVDPEVLQALNENWTKGDEDHTCEVWAPIFDELKKNNEIPA